MTITIPGAMAAGCLAALLAANASAAGREGKAIVEETCATCHASGREGAPRIGDERAWGARAARGLSALTRSALEGVRKMPPHGGKLALDDAELRRAIVYMVNRSGGNWAEPLDSAHAARERTGQEIVAAQCVRCHGTGVGGAPRLGDRDAWKERARRGFDSLVRSAIHGHGAMPARGGLADLTDPEMRSAVSLMVTSGLKGEVPGK